jgi:ADP-L-glycero-D-manno-heptose 6-epimerase
MNDRSILVKSAITRQESVMKKLVVTGGAGFIGSALVHKLNKEGIDDIVIVDALAESEKWKNLVGLRYRDYLHKNDFICKVSADCLNFKPQAVVHMGACSQTTMLDTDFLMENNYRYTQVLANWATNRGIRFIYASSAATYGSGKVGFSDEVDLRLLRPLNRYGYSKHLFDLHADRSGLFQKITGLKFFNVFGPNEYHKGDMTSVVFKAFHQIKKTGRMKLFKSRHEDYRDGEQIRDFVYVKDCVEIIWWLLTHESVNGLYNIGTGKPRTWNDLAKALFDAMECPTLIDYVEMPDTLQGSYQYFTQAGMERLKKTGCPLAFRSLEEAVKDYIVNHLATDNPYLDLRGSV